MDKPTIYRKPMAGINLSNFSNAIAIFRHGSITQSSMVRVSPLKRMPAITMLLPSVW